MDVLHKDNQRIIGSIIKINRVKQNISQKSLAKGICVPSYLSRIESGELLPSDDVISIIFSRLGLKFNDSEDFIKEGKENLDSFFDNLNFNEFDFTSKIFSKLEENEEAFITSPLILDYFLAKLARYCSTPCRDKFTSADSILLSSFDILSAKQKALYNFYLGVDILSLTGNIEVGKEYIKESLAFKENGHCYYWLSYAYRIENNPIKAYETVNRALDIYVREANFISIMNSYEKTAEVYFLLDNYRDALEYLEKSLKMAKTIKNSHYIEHINSIIAWAYYRLDKHTEALKFLNKNTGIADHRLVVPDVILKSLIYLKLNDKKNLELTISKIKNPQTLEQISEELSEKFYELFFLYIKDTNYIKNQKLEELLLFLIGEVNRFVELKKVLLNYLKDYYIQNRRYKEALLLF